MKRIPGLSQLRVQVTGLDQPFASLFRPDAQRESIKSPSLLGWGSRSKEDHSNYRGRTFFRCSGLDFFRIGRFDLSAAGPSKPRTRGRRFFFAMSASATTSRSYSR